VRDTAALTGTSSPLDQNILASSNAGKRVASSVTAGAAAAASLAFLRSSLKSHHMLWPSGELDASECANLILTEGLILTLSASNTINFLASCLPRPDS
jgi:hypothetical protein